MIKQKHYLATELLYELLEYILQGCYLASYKATPVLTVFGFDTQEHTFLC